MSNLVIKGHETRGKEVIQLLEMLGGVNYFNLEGVETEGFYYIYSGNNKIYHCLDISAVNVIVYTLEEFLEKFPYKVGDKVIIKAKNQEAIIDKIVWCCNTITYWLKYDGIIEGNWRVEHLQPYKEETMERKYNVEEYLEVWEETEEGLEVVVNNNFELKEDNGKFYIIKKQLQYLKTYEECEKVLRYDSHRLDNMGVTVRGYKWELIRAFQILLICRDAYWKIAGEQMGLDKPWESDFTNNDEERYGIYTLANKVEKDFCGVGDVNMILVFPTEEMRDVFFENFKELIEQCKELL